MAIPLNKISNRAARSNVSIHRLPSPALSDEVDQPDHVKDVEQPTATDVTPDPYQLRSAMMSEEQLNALRKRSKGNAVVNYQKKQNEVGA